MTPKRRPMVRNRGSKKGLFAQLGLRRSGRNKLVVGLIVLSLVMLFRSFKSSNEAEEGGKGGTSIALGMWYLFYFFVCTPRTLLRTRAKALFVLAQKPATLQLRFTFQSEWCCCMCTSIISLPAPSFNITATDLFSHPCVLSTPLFAHPLSWLATFDGSRALVHRCTGRLC